MMITLVKLTFTVSQSALKWNTIETVPPAVFPFAAHPGLKVPLSIDARPVEFLQLFFGDIMELLVEETNRSVN